MARGNVPPVSIAFGTRHSPDLARRSSAEASVSPVGGKSSAKGEFHARPAESRELGDNARAFSAISISPSVQSCDSIMKSVSPSIWLSAALASRSRPALRKTGRGGQRSFHKPPASRAFSIPAGFPLFSKGKGVERGSLAAGALSWVQFFARCWNDAVKP